MPRYPGKETNVVNETIAQGNPIELGEIGAQEGGIEQVAEANAMDAAAHEKMMNEILTIVAHHDNQEGAQEILNPTVNGINQPILRGVQQKVKRKYVEALARSRNTKYNQRQTDAGDPSSLLMVPNTKMACPFTVIHDPNPIGRERIEAILREQ